MDSSTNTTSWKSVRSGSFEQSSTLGTSLSTRSSEKSGRGSPRMFSRSESRDRLIESQDMARHKATRENKLAKMRIHRRNKALSDLMEKAGSIAETLQASLQKPEWPAIASRCKLGSNCAEELSGFFIGVSENLAEAFDQSQSSAEVEAIVAGAIDQYSAAVKWLEELESRIEKGNMYTALSPRAQPARDIVRVVSGANYDLAYLIEKLKDLPVANNAHKHCSPLLRTSGRGGKISPQPSRKFAGHDTRTRAAALQAAEASSRQMTHLMEGVDSLLKQLSEPAPRSVATQQSTGFAISGRNAGMAAWSPKSVPRRLDPTAIERSASWSTVVERRIKPARQLAERVIIQPITAEYGRIEQAELENPANKQAASTLSSSDRTPRGPNPLVRRSAIRTGLVTADSNSSATTNKSAAPNTRSRAASAIQGQTGSAVRQGPPQPAAHRRQKKHFRAVSQPLAMPAVAASVAGANSPRKPLSEARYERITPSQNRAEMIALLKEAGVY